MTKKGTIGILAGFLILGVSSAAFAAEGGAKAQGMWIYIAIAIACGLGMGIAVFGTGISMGSAISSALTGIARNPEASGKIQTNMIIGLALIESLCIYALLISLLMVFKIPALEDLMKAIGG